jgi:predicted subunit of tRNA(5-methylaminomethyl-2-thiouridylate) methyltransferase
MKIIIALLLFFSFNCQSQLVSGDMLADGRYLETKTDFTLLSSVDGLIYLQLSVDREGNVLSVQTVSDGTTVKSSYLQMEAKNMVKKFKFQASNYFPKHHHVVVKITYKKK